MIGDGLTVIVVVGYGNIAKGVGEGDVNEIRKLGDSGRDVMPFTSKRRGRVEGVIIIVIDYVIISLTYCSSVDSCWCKLGWGAERGLLDPIYYYVLFLFLW